MLVGLTMVGVSLAGCAAPDTGSLIRRGHALAESHRGMSRESTKCLIRNNVPSTTLTPQ